MIRLNDGLVDFIDDVAWTSESFTVRVPSDDKEAGAQRKIATRQNETFGRKYCIENLILPLRQRFDIGNVHVTRSKESLIEQTSCDKW